MTHREIPRGFLPKWQRLPIPARMTMLCALVAGV